MSNPIDHDAFGSSSIGIDPKIAAALSYIPIVGLIFYILEHNSAYVKFHSAQATILHVAMIVLGIVIGIINIILGFIPLIGALIIVLLRIAQGVGSLLLMITGGVQAWQGRRYAFPIIGVWAEQMSRSL